MIEGPPDENWDRVMINKNKMLWQFEGGDGVKTGFTNKAGRCLVSSATRNGMQLVCVVLNCGPMWDDSSALLEYGFNNYSMEKVVDRNSIFNVVEVKNGKEKFVGVKPEEDFYMPLKAGEKNNIQFSVRSGGVAVAPLIKGDDAGRLEVYIDNRLIRTVGLEYAESVESSSPFFYLRNILRDFISYTQ